MMTRLNFILVLGIAALLFACTIWVFDMYEERVFTNRTDPFGMSGKTYLDGDWKYIPCNGTTKNCGRLG